MGTIKYGRQGINADLLNAGISMTLQKFNKGREEYDVGRLLHSHPKMSYKLHIRKQLIKALISQNNFHRTAHLNNTQGGNNHPSIRCSKKIYPVLLQR
mmetsp:Transcript_14778/g.21108  ORF Transcript_14778/g.21108 Transcript_14778/m.21108 type:complete len:98 (+) Transcript_14778:757-1050(+)